ncbi:sulfurtransferase [Planococcus versutus]|uniref:Sulfurtransferase n=1 Tax=Planococcus versutus TaxID=1302659 RepID=A0A1B1RYX1_9BACL|nr:sulfurtransferase [Planococcus versutus]ANU26131.1 sulfurtransferase [Planococcus versutus]
MKQIPLMVTTEWLEKRLNDSDLCVIDATMFMETPESGGPTTICSGKESYQKGHIPGSIYINLLNDLSDPEASLPFTVPPRSYFIREMAKRGIGDGKLTVIYDQGTVLGESIGASYWASRLAWQMKYEGFDNIAILDGGILKWKKENRPLTTIPGVYKPVHYTGQRRTKLLATKEDVKQAIHDDQTILINSLSPEDYKGESDTYARKGHIPTSVNMYFAEHADNQTKEIYVDAILREQFEKTGALNPDKKVITYCGGGIAATWTALMLNKLGQKNVAIYDGSLNEWASDPNCSLIKES